MAPTICDDNMEPFGRQNRTIRHRSVINYVGRQTNRGVLSRNMRDSSDKDCHFQGNSGIIRYSSVAKRRCQEDASSSDSDDSTNSIPNPMTFHNYAKRRKYNESDDDSDKYMSSNENSVSSTLSFNDDSDRENIHIFDHPSPPASLVPASPVSSTTGSMSICHRFPGMRLRSKNRTLHAKLHQLKLETRAFVDSVMKNPENAKLRQTLSPSDEKLMAKTKILGLKNN